MQLYRMKYLKCLRTRKYSLEHKCEWNLSLVWLFLATVTFYLNCLDRVVLAHPLWALATFSVCVSVLSCWTNRAPSMGTEWSSWIWKNIHLFIHSVFCLTTSPKPPPKQYLHIVRSRASYFKWKYPLLSLRSSSSFLHLLPIFLSTRLLVKDDDQKSLGSVPLPRLNTWLGRKTNSTETHCYGAPSSIPSQGL